MKLPLFKLVTRHGEAARNGDVGAEAILKLLRRGPVRFVVADVGQELRWLPEENCFDFWKQEVLPHLAEPQQQVFLDQFPRGYAYFASQWDDGWAPIILLSKAH